MITLFANNEPPNWFGVAFLLTTVAWLAVHIVLTGVVGLLVYKVFRLIWQLQLRAEEAAADRRLTHDLLTIFKGWALVVEQKEEDKGKRMQAVAEVAEKTAVEIRQAVEATVKATANEVVAVLDQRAGGESGITRSSQ